jgi:hypothetical protein
MGCTQRENEKEQYNKFRAWLEEHTGEMSSLSEDIYFSRVLEKLDDMEIEGMW